MTPVNPLTVKLGHVILYRNGGYTQLCEVSKSIFDDILNGNPNYFYLPITREFLKAQKAELAGVDVYQITLAVLYNFNTKMVFHGGNPLCEMKYISQFQDLIQLLAGKPEEIKISERILI